MRYLIVCVLCWSSAVSAALAPVRVNVVFSPPLSLFCTAILEEAFTRLNRQVEVRTGLPAERSMQQVDRGVADADCMRVEGIKGIYRNIVQVPTPMFDIEFVAFTRKGVQLRPGWAGLKDYNVAAVKGWKLIEMEVKAVSPRSFAQVGSVDSLFRMLAMGRIDVAALNRLDGEQKRRELGLDHVLMQAPPLATVPLYVTFNHRHGTLVRELDAAFLEMKRDGSWQAIHQRILGMGSD